MWVDIINGNLSLEQILTLLFLDKSTKEHSRNAATRREGTFFPCLKSSGETHQERGIGIVAVAAKKAKRLLRSRLINCLILHVTLCTVSLKCAFVLPPHRRSHGCQCIVVVKWTEPEWTLKCAFELPAHRRSHCCQCIVVVKWTEPDW